MAKWLNKYFSLGNNKTKSPPQPPRPDYREKRNGAGSMPCPNGPLHLHLHHHISPGFPHRCLHDDMNDLLYAYRAQKDRDFEDPYSGPGSSLRKLRAMCHLDYSAPEDQGEAAPKAFSSSSCCAMPTATYVSGSPHLFRSHSERCQALPPDMKYISPKHWLIKIESNSGNNGTVKKLNKGSKQLATSVPSAMKDKVLIADDYSDPFDAKSELNRIGKGENTGYMEPYEAQRIMTG
ncbi:SHB protein, partial [Pluvianellus socialis]|nr:SHB protein [Pluvianellus socialis]